MNDTTTRKPLTTTGRELTELHAIVDETGRLSWEQTNVIAAGLGVTTSKASGILGRLERRGLVQHITDTMQRTTRWCLTPAGRDLVQRTERIYR